MEVVVASYRDVVRDDSGYQRPVEGALVYLLGPNEALVAADENPVRTNDFGVFEFTSVPDGTYMRDIRFGGVSYARDSVIVGDPPEYTGATGPSNNTRLTLAILKAADTTDRTSLYDGSLWTWETAGAPYIADDLNIVKADSTELSIGAWVRQSAQGVVFKAAGAQAVPRRLESKSRDVVSVKDFGAVGDNSTDDRAAAQTAYQALVDAGGGTLHFPSGEYRIALRLTSRNVHISGDARGGTALQAFSAAEPVLRAIYRNGDTQAVNISDLNIQGVGEGQGNGFQTGEDTYEPGDEYSGDTHFYRVRFTDLEKAICRQFGSIDLLLDNCNVRRVDYVIWSRGSNGQVGSDLMHAGCAFVRGGRYAIYNKAFMYIDSPVVGTGQIVVENAIIESAPGFVFYIKSFACAGGEPGIVVRSCWNENNATGTNVTIEGVTHANARYLYASDSLSPVVFDDTPIGSLELINSSVVTRDCNLANLSSITADARSFVTHDRPRAFTGTPLGSSAAISGPTVAYGLETPWFKMHNPMSLSKAFDSQVLIKYDCSTPIAFTGTVSVNSSSVSDAVLPGMPNGQELTIGADQTLFPATFSVPNNTWLVAIIVARVTSGGPVSIRISGPSAISGLGTISGTSWQTYVGVVENRSGALSGERFEINATNISTIRLGGMAVLLFSTKQEAMDFANQRVFPL